MPVSAFPRHVRPTPLATRGPHRRAFSLVELVLAVVLFGVLAAVAMTGWRRVREEAEETRVLNAMRVLQGAQQTWRSTHPSFQLIDTTSQSFAQFQRLAGYTREADIVLMAQMATATRWAGIMRRADGGQVCAALIDRVRSTSAVDCGTTPVFPIALSSATPGAGEAVTLDVTTAIALLLADQRPQPFGELAAQGSGMRQREPVLIGWDFGDGSAPVGGPVSTHARLRHTFAKGPAERCPIRVAVLDASGQVHVGEASGGAQRPFGSCALPSSLVPDAGTPAPPTLNPNGENRPPEGTLRLSATQVQPGQYVTASATTAFDPDGRIVAWRWTVNGVAQGDTTVRSLRQQMPTTAGTVTIGLTLVDDRGATTPLSGTVTVGAATGGFQAAIQVEVEGQSREIISSRRAVNLTGTVTGAPAGSALSYRWELGSSETLMGQSIQKRFAFPGLYRLRLVVTGPNGTQAVDERTISVVANNPPVALGTAQPLADSTGSPVVFQDNGSSDSDGPLTGLTHRWIFPDGSERVGSPTTVTFSSPGTYAVRHQVLDDLGDMDEDTVTVQIWNRAPRGGSVSCAPTAVFSHEAVTCTAGEGWSDPDGGTLAYTWNMGTVWTGTGEGSATVTGAWRTPGPRTVQLTVSDGQGGSTPVTTTVTVQNRPPTGGSLVCDVPGQQPPFLSQSVVLCSAIGWVDPDGDPNQPGGTTSTLSYTITYPQTGGQAGQSSSFVPPKSGLYPVSLTVQDPQGGTATASATVQILNRIPSAPTVTCTPLSTQTGTLATCSIASGSLLDADGVVTSVTWSTEGLVDVSGATGGVVGTTATYRRMTPGAVSVVARSVDDEGAQSALSLAQTIGFTNRPPPVPTVSCDAGAVPSDSLVTCVASGSDDPDGGVVIYVWSWEQLESTTGAGSSIGRFRRSTPGTFTVTVQAQDDQGGVTVASPPVTVTVTNRAPSAPTLVCTPPSPQPTGSTVSCVASGSSDPDGGTVTYEWNWTGSIVPPVLTGAGYATAAFSIATPGPATIFVRALDGQTGAPNGAGASAWVPASLTALNRAPVHAGTSCSALTTAVGTPITCTSSWSDPDGGSLEYFMGYWESTGSTNVVQAVWRSTNSLTFTPAAPGEYGLWVGVRDNQGFDCSASWNPPGDGSCWTRYAVITVTNAPPTAPTVTCTPSGTQPTSTVVTCTASGSTDPDGGIITYSWSSMGRTGPTTGPSTTYTLATAGISANEQTASVSVIATASDGQGGSTPSSGTTVTFRNRPPSDGTVAASPGWTVTSGTAVTFTFSGYSDPDGDVVSYLAYLTRYPDNVAARGEGLSTSATFAYGCCGELPGGENAYRVVWGTLAGNNQPAVVTATYTRPGTYQIGGGPMDNTSAPSWRDRGSIANFALLTVTNRDPSPPSLVCAPTPVSVGQSTTCTASGGSDPDGGTISYDWDVPSGGGLTLALSGPGNSVATLTRTTAVANLPVQVRASDGQSWAPNGVGRSPWVSTSLTWSNTPPTTPTVSCVSSSAPTATPITCSASGSTDPDGGTILYTWSSPDRTGPATGPNTTFTRAIPGTTSVTVTATDGQGGSTISAPVVLTLLNRAPSVPTTASCSPTSTPTGSTIVCMAVFSGSNPDPEGAPDWTFVWSTLDGQGGVVSGPRNNTLTLTRSQPGAVVPMVAITDNATTAAGGAGTSPAIMAAGWGGVTFTNRYGALVASSCPNGTAGAIAATAPFECSATVGPDPEGHAQQVSIRLYRGELCWDEEWSLCWVEAGAVSSAWSPGSVSATLSAVPGLTQTETTASVRLTVSVIDGGGGGEQVLQEATLTSTRLPLGGGVICSNDNTSFTCTLTSWQNGVTSGWWQIVDDEWNMYSYWGTSATHAALPGSVYTLSASPMNTAGWGAMTTVTHTFVPPAPAPGATWCSGEPQQVLCWISGWTGAPTGLTIQAVQTGTGAVYTSGTHSPWGAVLQGLPGDATYMISVRVTGPGGMSPWVGYGTLYIPEASWGCDYGWGPEPCY